MPLGLRRIGRVDVPAVTPRGPVSDRASVVEGFLAVLRIPSFPRRKQLNGPSRAFGAAGVGSEGAEENFWSKLIGAGGAKEKF